MLAALAGLAGLLLMKNPGKKRRKARRNPSLRKRREAAKKRMLKKYEGINRRTFKSPWSTYPGHSKLARRHKHWTMARRAGISHGKLAKAREHSVRGLLVKNPGKRRGRRIAPSTAGARLAKWRWHRNPLPVRFPTGSNKVKRSDIKRHSVFYMNGKTFIRAITKDDKLVLMPQWAWDQLERKNPIRRGKGRSVIAGNIRKLIHDGMPQRQAIAVAYAASRR